MESASTNSTDAALTSRSSHKPLPTSPPSAGPKFAPPLATSPPLELPQALPGPFKPSHTAATNASSSTASSTTNSNLRYVLNTPSQASKSSSPLSVASKSSGTIQSPSTPGMGVTSPCSSASKTKSLPPLPHSLVTHPPSVDIDRRPPALLPSEVGMYMYLTNFVCVCWLDCLNKPFNILKYTHMLASVGT